LRVITEAPKRGSDAVVALPWVSVREKAITAAFIERRWTGSSVAKTSHSAVPSWDYFKD